MNKKEKNEIITRLCEVYDLAQKIVKNKQKSKYHTSWSSIYTILGYIINGKYTEG